MNEMNNNPDKNVWMKIKSKYILIKIFDHLRQNILLETIRYNKKLQKISNKKLKDYKNESSNIIIEITPAKNMYGIFINLMPRYKLNYHIYFDNNKNEIKRNIIYSNENVSKIKVIIDDKVKTLSKLFSKCKCIKSINFIKFKNNNINNMKEMFDGCSSLEELNISNFITDKVTNMKLMFKECSLLKKLDLSSFNTANVLNMGSMFHRCSSLKELNLDNFNTDKVYNMIDMFSGCRELEKLNISNFKTYKNTDISFMFDECLSLKELNLMNFNTYDSFYIVCIFSRSSTIRIKCTNEFKNIIKNRYPNIIFE